jgi:hemolysin activation/secretion protein
LVSIHRHGKFLLAAALLACGYAAHSQDAPTFSIRGYQIEGNSLLPQDRISLTVMPFTGAKSSFETIQLALEALEKAYLQAGYGSVKIEVPEQDLHDGVVRLLVVEARLDRVVVEGAKFHDEANILRTLPALRKGEVVNLDQLQRNINLANESFAKNVGVTFRQSEATAQTDALVRVADEQPMRFVASIDNTGSKTTGRYRLGVSLLHANLFNLDHMLSVQLLSSPTAFDKVAILGLGYRIPLYALGDSVDFTLGYSNVDSGRIDLFSVSGSGLILGARYNHNLANLGDWEHKLSYSVDRRNYGNSVVPTAGGASLVPDLQVTPLGLGYSGSRRSAQRDVAASVTLAHNLAGGRRGDTAAFNQPGGRAGADASFTTLKASANLTERLSPDWSLRGAVSAQFSNDLLISAEQFGAGGADSVRGFAEREVAADRGVRTGFEVWGPDVASRAGVPGLRVQPIAFLDAAWVKFNVAPGTIQSQTISSIGLGLRGAWERSANFRLDYGYVLKGAQNTAGANTASGRGSWRLHGTALWFF